MWAGRGITVSILLSFIFVSRIERRYLSLEKGLEYLFLRQTAVKHKIMDSYKNQMLVKVDHPPNVAGCDLP
jgi:hypothetical protein